MRLSQLLEEIIHQHFCWEVGQSLSFEDNIQTCTSRQIKTTSRRNNFIISYLFAELQRFFWHIVNLWNLNGFGDMPFPIGFALRITWTFLWYDQTKTTEKLCKPWIKNNLDNLGFSFPVQFSFLVYWNPCSGLVHSKSCCSCSRNLHPSCTTRLKPSKFSASDQFI